jgi:hypothetical protein
LQELTVAERLGWTLDYIRSFSYGEFMEIHEMLMAKTAAEVHLQKRAMKRGKS